jgi:hypothetical protein
MNNMPQAIQSGNDFGATLAPLGVLAPTIPGLNKVSKVVPGNTKVASVARNVLKGGAEQFATGTGYGLIHGESLPQALGTGLSFAPYGALQATRPEGQLKSAAVNPNGKVLPMPAHQIETVEAEAKTARQDYEEWSRAVKQQETPRTTTGAVNDAMKAIKTNTISPAAKDVSTYKDISGFNGQARDVYRNFKQVFGNKYETIKRTVLDPFDRSKGVFTKNLETHANELDNNIVKKYGFQKGSRESAAIQEYGEGTKTAQQLVKEFGQAKAKNIIEADKWFRNQYDTLLAEVNAVRKKIYPNDPTKIIPRRSDYYRHFKDMQEGFSGLVNIFDSPSNIQSGLSGISANTKPSLSAVAV